MKNQTTHGGPRPGAGRPSNASKGLPSRIKASVYLDRDWKAFFIAYAHRHGLPSWGNAIEQAGELLKEREDGEQ